MLKDSFCFILSLIYIYIDPLWHGEREIFHYISSLIVWVILFLSWINIFEGITSYKTRYAPKYEKWDDVVPFELWLHGISLYPLWLTPFILYGVQLLVTSSQEFFNDRFDYGMGIFCISLTANVIRDTILSKDHMSTLFLLHHIFSGLGLIVTYWTSWKGYAYMVWVIGGLEFGSMVYTWTIVYRFKFIRCLDFFVMTCTHLNFFVSLIVTYSDGMKEHAAQYVFGSVVMILLSYFRQEAAWNRLREIEHPPLQLLKGKSS